MHTPETLQAIFERESRFASQHIANVKAIRIRAAEMLETNANSANDKVSNPGIALVTVMSKLLEHYGNFIPRRLRIEVYFPAKEDLRCDIIEGNLFYSGGWERKVFLASVVWKTFLLFACTIWTGLIRVLDKLTPEILKGIWRLFT